MVFFARLDIKLRDEEGPSFGTHGTGVDCTPARRLSPAFSFARERDQVTRAPARVRMVKYWSAALSQQLTNKLTSYQVLLIFCHV